MEQFNNVNIEKPCFNVTIGTDCVIEGDRNVVVGCETQVTGDHNTIVGSQLKITGDNLVIIGGYDVSQVPQVIEENKELRREMAVLREFVHTLLYHPDAVTIMEDARERFES